MKLHMILSAVVLAAGITSLNVYAEDAAKPAMSEAQAEKDAGAVKGHNHECENKGIGCVAKAAAPAKKPAKRKGGHNHECEMKHTGCQDPTK